MTDLIEYIENHTLRSEVSRRGGGIEVDASEFLGVADARMTAFQNYLGGAMLGAINSSRNAAALRADQGKADELADALMRYFYSLTEPQAEEYDEWSAASFDAIQQRPGSAY